MCHLNKKPKGKKPETYFSWSNNRLGKVFSNNTKKNQKKPNNIKIFPAGKVNNPNNLNPPPAGKEKASPRFPLEKQTRNPPYGRTSQNPI